MSSRIAHSLVTDLIRHNILRIGVVLLGLSLFFILTESASPNLLANAAMSASR